MFLEVTETVPYLSDSEMHLGKPVINFESQFSSKYKRVEKNNKHTTLPRRGKYERLLVFPALGMVNSLPFAHSQTSPMQRTGFPITSAE